MDCIEFLTKLKDKSVDLAVVDPPYNLKVASWDTFTSHDEFLDFTFQWLDELILKLKSHASLYIFNTPFNSAYILQHLCEKDMIFQNWIVWDKRDGLSCTKKRYTNGQETILYFTKSNDYTFNYDDIRISYDSTDRMKNAKTKGIIKNGKRWYPNPNGKLCNEIWHFSSERHRTKVNGRVKKQSHYTIKPLEMIERIIKASSNENDLVIDCFSGSGTTALACQNLQRNFIGCDNNAEYNKIAKSRLGDKKIECKMDQ
jgi:site-specific DNA-methyltransferase (adenine-specific)